jgi:anti-sigma B factor antagonist
MMTEQVFEVQERTQSGAAVVSVVGEVDLATAPELRTVLDKVLDGGASTLVVDLSASTFIDSTALGVLIGAWKRSQNEGRAMSVVAADPRILRVFEITGLTDLFPLHGSLDEALVP